MNNRILLLTVLLLVAELAGPLQAQRVNKRKRGRLVYKEYLLPGNPEFREKGYEDRAGRRQGEWVICWPDGTRYAAGPYRDGKRHGTWVTFRKKDGTPEAPGREWVEGAWQVRVRYKNDLGTLKAEYWRTEDGKGVREYRSFYETGDPESEGWYDDSGNKSGQWRFFYATAPYCDPDGSPCRFPTGVFTRYMPYRNRFTLFREPYGTEGNGRALKCEGEYAEGYLQGVWPWYRPDGRKWFTCEYDRGQRHGVWSGWTEEGRLAGEARYEDGKLTGRGTLYDDGKTPIACTQPGKMRQRITAVEGIDAIRLLPGMRNDSSHLLWHSAIDQMWRKTGPERVIGLADSGYLIRPEYMEKLAQNRVFTLREIANRELYKPFYGHTPKDVVRCEEETDRSFSYVEELSECLEYLYETYGAGIPLPFYSSLFNTGHLDSLYPFLGEEVADYFFRFSPYHPAYEFVEGDFFYNTGGSVSPAGVDERAETEEAEEKICRNFLDLALGNNWLDSSMVRYLVGRGVKVYPHHIRKAQRRKAWAEEEMAYATVPGSPYYPFEKETWARRLGELDEIIEMLREACR